MSMAGLWRLTNALRCATLCYSTNKLPRKTADTAPGLVATNHLKEGSTTMSLIAYLGLVVIAGPVIALSIFAAVYNAIEGMWK